MFYQKLFINNSEIERVDSLNFLGLQLNHNLNWTKHVNYISLKMSKIIGIIYKLKSVFPTAILRSMYNTLLLPHMCAGVTKETFRRDFHWIENKFL